MFLGLNVVKSSISIVFLCNSYRNHVCRVPDMLHRVAHLKTSYLTPPSHLKQTMKKWRGAYFSALNVFSSIAMVGYASDRVGFLRFRKRQLLIFDV